MHRGKRGAFHWEGVAAVERLAGRWRTRAPGRDAGWGVCASEEKQRFSRRGALRGAGGGQRACAASFCCQRVRADVVVGWN